jgi:hypothetical protein
MARRYGSWMYGIKPNINNNHSSRRIFNCHPHSLRESLSIGSAIYRQDAFQGPPLGSGLQRLHIRRNGPVSPHALLKPTANKYSGCSRGLTLCHSTRKYIRQPPSTLDAAFKAAGKEYVGTALTIRDDAQEEEIITTQFGSITPENAMKWESTQPSQGTFTFDGADAVVAFAKQHDQKIRCHTLVWYSQLPTWVSNGGFDNATLLQVVKTHIDTVVGRYKGVCDQWDVVNEGELLPRS